MLYNIYYVCMCSACISLWRGGSKTPELICVIVNDFNSHIKFLLIRQPNQQRSRCQSMTGVVIACALPENWYDIRFGKGELFCKHISGNSSCLWGFSNIIVQKEFGFFDLRCEHEIQESRIQYEFSWMNLTQKEVFARSAIASSKRSPEVWQYKKIKKSPQLMSIYLWNDLHICDIESQNRLSCIQAPNVCTHICFFNL